MREKIERNTFSENLERIIEVDTFVGSNHSCNPPIIFSLTLICIFVHNAYSLKNVLKTYASNNNNINKTHEQRKHKHVKCTETKKRLFQICLAYNMKTNFCWAMSSLVRYLNCLYFFIRLLLCIHKNAQSFRVYYLRDMMKLGVRKTVHQ